LLERGNVARGSIAEVAGAAGAQDFEFSSGVRVMQLVHVDIH